MGRLPRKYIPLLIGLLMTTNFRSGHTSAQGADLQVGFAVADITPKIRDDTPVWLAGYGFGRRATGIHDPLKASAVVLRSGTKKLAFVSVDLVGLQFPEVQTIRQRLTDFAYVMVSSTHNHEGPDVIGIWGKTPFLSGVDREFLSALVEKVVSVVRRAESAAVNADSHYGTAEDENLLRDSRLPKVKDGVLRAIRFESRNGQTPKKLVGILVQWNCHPEAMGSKNTLVTADFPAATVAWLKQHYGCPVAYFTGAVGGLMAPALENLKDESGKQLFEGDFASMEKYGQAVGQLARKAIDSATPINLAPIAFSSKTIAVPVDNQYYLAAREVGTLSRSARIWTGDPEQLGAQESSESKPTQQRICIESEVAYLRLGELGVACIPGEIYPELVYGKFQDPADPNADFPDAPLEPTIASTVPDKKWLLFGLANDEVGYIIPKRQWDNVAPFAYGRSKSQYGEINSCGADTAPILMETLVRRVREVEGR